MATPLTLSHQSLVGFLVLFKIIAAQKKLLSSCSQKLWHILNSLVYFSAHWCREWKGEWVDLEASYFCHLFCKSSLYEMFSFQYATEDQTDLEHVHALFHYKCVQKKQVSSWTLERLQSLQCPCSVNKPWNSTFNVIHEWQLTPEALN